MANKYCSFSFCKCVIDYLDVFNNNNNNKVHLYTAPKSKKSLGAAAWSSKCVLAAFWTVRSLQPLTAQQANSFRLLGQRLWTIYHRALSLSLVPHTWRRQLNVVGECHRWPSWNRRPGMEVPSRSVPWTPVWRTRHGVGLAASVVLVERTVWYVHIDLCEWPASQRHCGRTVAVVNCTIVLCTVEVLCVDVLCVQMFANQGLRTLCCAVREISCDEFMDWKQRHHEARLYASHYVVCIFVKEFSICLHL